MCDKYNLLLIPGKEPSNTKLVLSSYFPCLPFPELNTKSIIRDRITVNPKR